MKLDGISLSRKEQRADDRRETESHLRKLASLGGKLSAGGETSISVTRGTFSFSLAVASAVYASRTCLRICARVYETYFSVEHLSIVERRQRRRANRRALPNANTVFTCDCSSTHLDPVQCDGSQSRGYNRVSIPSHLAAPSVDDPAAARSRAFARNSNDDALSMPHKDSKLNRPAPSDSREITLISVFILNYLEDSRSV